MMFSKVSTGLLFLLSCLWSVQGRILQTEDRVRTDLIRLIPFEVQLAMQGPIADVNVQALTDIITDWLSDSFADKSVNQEILGNETTFESLGLEIRTGRRNLQEFTGINLFAASYEGVTLWERRGLATPPVEQEVVEYIQRATFLEDSQLLNSLQGAPANTGLGDAVVDVRVFISVQPQASSNTNSNLEIIIIIAIVVACLAFGLLMFAVIWAWRTDQAKREAYKVGEQNLQPVHVPTGSESEYNERSPPPQPPTKKLPATGMTPPAVASPQASSSLPSSSGRPPSEINPNDYPDSVISEDISTSLTAYYRSGMPTYNRTTPRELNDAASMSSMDSYGYSLDGYAPSLGPAPQGYPVGPMNGMIKDPDADYEGDEDDGVTASSLGDSLK